MAVLFAGGGTGGHLYPALAIARALVAADPSERVIFVGARRGIERELLPTTEFRHELLDLHPLYRSRPWENWRTLRGASISGMTRSWLPLPMTRIIPPSTGLSVISAIASSKASPTRMPVS